MIADGVTGLLVHQRLLAIGAIDYGILMKKKNIKIFGIEFTAHIPN